MTNGIALTSIDAVVLGLQQLDLHIADGEGVVLSISIREIRHGGAGDGHNDQHGRQAQGYDLLLSHDSFFLSFMYLNKFGETNAYRITACSMR